MKLITLNQDPNIIVSKKVTEFLNPDYIYLPVDKNKIMVKQNDLVLIDAPVSRETNIVSSISGMVTGLRDVYINGTKMKSLVIKNNYKENRINLKRTAYSQLNLAYFLDVLAKKDASLLAIFKNLKKVDNIIINAVEDEPYVANNIMLFKDNLNELLGMLDELSILYKSNTNAIIIKEKDSTMIEECLKTIGSFPNINITLVKDYYLLSQKPYLLAYLKVKNETLYLSIKDLLKLANIIHGLDQNNVKYLTISGNALKEGKVFKVKKYCSLAEIMTKYLKLKTTDYELIVNGLMRGYLGQITDLIITDEIDSIILMQKEEQHISKCFNCGKCLNVCPVDLNPIYLYKKNKPTKKCLNCGLCNYVCPAHIDLKTKIRGKAQ